MSSSESFLLLSIRREHAQRILEGSKIYELRKRLPGIEFKRVYMYETGGGGIVGCFDPLRVLKDRKGLLWDQVNYHATTRARFESYFEGSADGFAIEVSNPVKFKTPVTLQELREVDPGFHVPMSSRRVLKGSRLGLFLESKRRSFRRREHPAVTLLPIAPSERERYKELVLKHIGARYEGIDDTFAERTLDVHDVGHDEAGFFTDSKSVYSIWNRKNHVGFTTVTWKNNGCAKTGPTIIELAQQNKGFGRATRAKVERLVRAEGFRKIYCTCADNAPDVVAYLLDSGMKIEAHLDRQYSSDHGEFVFGKFLVADEYADIPLPARTLVSAKLLDPKDVRETVLSRDFKLLFEDAWTPVSADFSDRITRDGISRRKPDPRYKAKRIVCIGNKQKLCGITVLLPKRGGSMKALMAASTCDIPTIRAMVDEVARLSCVWGIRKIYYLQPLLDVELVKVLRSSQFQMEGFLRSPYKAGQDVGIFSRFC